MDPALDTRLDTPPRTQAGEHAYTELKRRLLVGDFPLRIRLGEERLATLLSVSRTPVRQALARLHAERLVERLPDGGYVPAASNLVEVRQLYEVRRALELAALHRPVETGEPHDPAVVEPLRDDWLVLRRDTPEPDPGFVLLDESFHVRLAEATGNNSLAGMLGVVNERIRVVRMHDFLSAERIDRTITQHLGILEAVLGGDLDTAHRRFTMHLGESVAVVEQRAAQALTRMMAVETRGLS
ncbi:GntR family transcriptional regulator [Micromonospora sp. LOL_023]|uniref:GntR family transcriptional regulator n=1 Tax=Micromonospora sp. LOL_023 TaxID=3345418 RepID=UPI003A8C7C9C